MEEKALGCMKIYLQNTDAPGSLFQRRLFLTFLVWRTMVFVKLFTESRNKRKCAYVYPWYFGLLSADSQSGKLLKCNFLWRLTL